MSDAVTGSFEVLKDYVTGRETPNVGAEENRQAVEKALVELKGYSVEDIQVNAPVEFEVQDSVYKSTLDLVVRFEGRPLMVVKCAAGSLGSREREVLAGARIGVERPAFLAVVSDGVEWIVLWTNSGKVLGRGLEVIPTYEDAEEFIERCSSWVLNEDRTRRERLIFRSYDMDNVNQVRGG